jgi:CubicO group peptidase (beta-lactamase class C family)
MRVTWLLDLTSRRGFIGNLAIAALTFAMLVEPAQPARADSVDDYIRAQIARRKIPGLALAVVQRGQVIKLAGHGLASVELDAPVTPDTVFELASVTKQFTAAAVMKLVEDGKVALDEPVSKYLSGTPPTWQAITIRHLLTHTAGLPKLSDGFAALWKNGVKMNYTTEQAFDAATKDAMSFGPGDGWQYSDVGYFLLGMVIERVSGQRYAAFLANHFFIPLGMTSTSVIDQWAVVPHRAPGYTLRNGQLSRIRRDVQFGLASHYGVLSSVRDLVKWEAALDTASVLSGPSLAVMWTQVTLNDGSRRPYGFGWFVTERRGHRLIDHSGITGTQFSRFPNDHLTVIVLTNLGYQLGGQEVDAWGLSQGVAGHYLPGLLLSGVAKQPDPDAARTQRLRAFLDRLGRGEDSADALPGLTAAMRPNMAEIKRVLGKRIAELRSFTYITTDAREANAEWLGVPIRELVHYQMVTASETRYYTFWLTADGRIANFTSYAD